jgi:hypothetical protein
MDALAYSQISNNLTTDQLNSTGLTNRFLQKAPDQTKFYSYLDSVLSNTTIKRACCNNLNRPGSTGDAFSVSVRIPVPTDFDFTKVPLGDFWSSFGYVDKSVAIPKSMCANTVPGYDYTTDSCQDFMTLYCNNAKAWYKDEIMINGRKYDDKDFFTYKPECGCFGDKPSYITGNPSPSCYMPTCDPNNSSVFIDSLSRGGCSATFCSSNLNVENLKAGGAVGVTSSVVQNCGQQSAGGTTPSTPSTPAVIPPQQSADNSSNGSNSGGSNESNTGESNGNNSNGSNTGNNSNESNTDNNSNGSNTGNNSNESNTGNNSNESNTGNNSNESNTGNNSNGSNTNTEQSSTTKKTIIPNVSNTIFYVMLIFGIIVLILCGYSLLKPRRRY